MTTAYDAKHIKRLSGLEAIRRLPGMYVGDNAYYGLHHILMELIDNGVDEILNGHGNTIKVTLHNDGSASIWDNARGIPVEYKRDAKLSALTEVFTVLHAGGKFREEGEQDAYLSGSGGLHGIGVKATNAFSEWLQVEVRRNGVIYRQRFEEGGAPKTLVQIVEPEGKMVGQITAKTKMTLKKGMLTGLTVNGKTKKVQSQRKLGTGTRVHFRPYREWFDEDMEWPTPEEVPWDFNRLATRLEQIAHLHPGVQIELADERGPTKNHKHRHFYSNKGLLDYIQLLNKNQKVLHKPVHLKDKSEDGSVTIEVVLQYTEQDESSIYSFVNAIPTPLGGTAVSGMQAGLTKAVNQFGSNKKLIKGENIRGDDLLLGLTAIVNVTMSKTPQFSSQTKEALTSSEIKGVATSITYEHLLAYLNKHISIGKAIVNQAKAAARGREAAKAARKLVMRKSALEVDELPGKLADVARGIPVEQTMLYIVEGDSAGGSCKMARDRRYHAILPMRGKILNTERATITKMLGTGKGGGNTEIKAIVSAIGGGIGSDFDTGEMRYGGVAILVDADVDGAHIRTLLHTLFWRHMKPLVMAGKLYIAVAPLYQLKKGSKTAYAYSDKEREKILEEWGGEKVITQRYKGLGEMNPGQLRETVFKVDKATGVFNEHLLQVVVEDAQKAGQMMGTLMGSAVAPRKEWLLKTWAGEESDEEMIL
ncbi:MAG: toprim domain-containing protein [Chloroflexota bacterium]